MSRYIDADALHMILVKMKDFGELTAKKAIRAVENAPTVDAEPVRHGKWDKGTDSHWHICEECGAEVDISMGTGVWVEGVELRELKYCPNCGCRMDVE